MKRLGLVLVAALVMAAMMMAMAMPAFAKQPNSTFDADCDDPFFGGIFPTGTDGKVTAKEKKDGSTRWHFNCKFEA